MASGAAQGEAAGIMDRTLGWKAEGLGSSPSFTADPGPVTGALSQVGITGLGPGPACFTRLVPGCKMEADGSRPASQTRQ